MNRKQRIIVSITGILLVSLILIGLTYGYFLTKINGNTNSKSISVTTANLELTYGDGTTALLTSIDPIMPGEFTASKDFTVTNSGNATVQDYAVVIEDFSVVYASTTDEVVEGDKTYLNYPDDMKITLSCKNSDGSNCNGINENDNRSLPTTNDILVTNTIEQDEVQTYTLTITYVDSGVDQSSDMNKRIEGKINIMDTSYTIDLTGIVSNYEIGDYVQTNSTPRISSIDKNGNYKVVGLEPGKHTIRVYSKTGSVKGSQDITIERGNIPAVSDNVITINEESRTVNININSDYALDIGGIKQYNPYKEGTLAYTILNNSYNLTEEEKNKSYAEYKTEPLTDIALKTSANKYSKTNYLVAYTDVGVSTPNSYKDYYVTYGTGFEFDEITGIPTLLGIATCKYSECYQTLVGKYMYSTIFRKNMSEKDEVVDAISPMVGQVNTAPAPGTGSFRVKMKQLEPVTESSIEHELLRTIDNDGTSYYYRGGISNNYVNFSNMCWRIVRIEGDGSIKLILASSNGTCNTSGVLTDDSGYIKEDNTVVTANFGYENVTTDSNTIPIMKYYNIADETSVYKKLINWFDNNNFNKSKLKKDKWYIDKETALYSLSSPYSMLENSRNDLILSGTKYMYYTDKRLTGLGEIANALLNYSSDLYNYIESYIGLISADEVVFAGGVKEKTNRHYYLTDNAKTNWWWVLSSRYFDGTAEYAFDVGPDIISNSGAKRYITGYLGFEKVSSDTSDAIRPSIVLKNGTLLKSGIGTVDDPYIIE